MEGIFVVTHIIIRAEMKILVLKLEGNRVLGGNGILQPS
jgi:hypothetical protein